MAREFVIADTHFDHNVIDFFGRRFPDLESMNDTLVRNWNNAVSCDDTVYVIGDFGYNPDKWQQYLDGRIVLLKGNHDENQYLPVCLPLQRNGSNYLLIHNPKRAPRCFDGWIVHGHMHNRSSFPFIDGVNRRINISVERIGYTPLPIEKLFGIGCIEYQETYQSKPRMKEFTSGM